MTQTNLLPCPFCSGSAQIRDDGHHYYAECQSCFVKGLDCTYSEDAAKQWNTRHTPKRELVTND